MGIEKLVTSLPQLKSLELIGGGEISRRRIKDR